MKNIFYLLLFSFLVGCSSFEYSNHAFKEGDQIDLGRIQYRRDFIRGLYTFKGENVYITDLVRYIKNDASVVYSSDLLNESFSVDVENVSMAELMKVVSSSLSCSVEHMGRLWVFTRVDKKSDSDLNPNKSTATIEYTYFFEIMGYSENEVVSNLSVFQVKKISNGFYCFRGSLMDAISLDDMLMEMMKNQPVQYFFSVWFISEDVLRDLSVRLNSKAELNIKKVLGDLTDDSQWSLVFDALGSSSFDMSNTDMVRKISGVVREGGEFVFNVGDEVPIPKRTVSESGTVTDTGYEYQQTGLSLRLSCEGKSRGVLTMDLENTDISGYVGTYPVKHGSHLQTVLIVSDERRSYVGSCQMTTKSKGIFGWNSRSSKYHVFLQCDLVGYGQRVSTDIEDY